MMPTVIVYGPPGCGKSTNAEILRAYFGCMGVEENDGLGPLEEGKLHLTNLSCDDVMHYLLRYPYNTVLIVSFERAMQKIEERAKAARLTAKASAHHQPVKSDSVAAPRAISVVVRFEGDGMEVTLDPNHPDFMSRVGWILLATAPSAEKRNG